MISTVVVMTLGRCISPHAECLCGPGWAVLGDVVETDGGAVVRGTSFGPAPQDPPANAPAGSRVLVNDHGELTVSDAGMISCRGISLDALAYAPTIADGGCNAVLDNAGLVQGPCRDTVGPCGCSASVTNVSLAALISIAIRSMKRRRADL